MEPVGAWESIIQQSPLVAFMVVVIWYGARYVKDMLEKAEKREEIREEAANKREVERERRQNELVDTLIKIQGEQVGSILTALNASTNVMERVERKLDADTTYTRD